MRTNYGGNFVEGRIFWFVFTLFTMSKFSDSSILRSFLHLSIWLFPKDYFYWGTLVLDVPQFLPWLRASWQIVSCFLDFFFRKKIIWFSQLPIVPKLFFVYSFDFDLNRTFSPKKLQKSHNIRLPVVQIIEQTSQYV